MGFLPLGCPLGLPLRTLLLLENHRNLYYKFSTKETMKRGDTEFFRKLGRYGIISYNEYLFLLCIITKPKEGFEVAFKMFDTDGNKLIDREEFRVLEDIFRQSAENSVQQVILT